MVLTVRNQFRLAPYLKIITTLTCEVNILILLRWLIYIHNIHQPHNYITTFKI